MGSKIKTLNTAHFSCFAQFLIFSLTGKKFCAKLLLAVKFFGGFF